jgi:hypothetical protein
VALKVGTEDKKKVAIAATLGVLVLGLTIYTLVGYFGGSPSPAPPPAVAVSATKPAQRVNADGSAVKAPTPLTNLDPTLHPELMAQAESLEYSGHGRNIFSMFSTPAVIEAVKGPIRPGALAAALPQGPPPPPPIDLKFFGFVTREGNRRAFLLHGEDVFIASEGDVVDHHFKVLKISPFSLQVTDLLYSNTQTLPLIQN